MCRSLLCSGEKAPQNPLNLICWFCGEDEPAWFTLRNDCIPQSSNVYGLGITGWPIAGSEANSLMWVEPHLLDDRKTSKMGGSTHIKLLIYSQGTSRKRR